MQIRWIACEFHNQHLLVLLDVAKLDQVEPGAAIYGKILY